MLAINPMGVEKPIALIDTAKAKENRDIA